MSWQENLSFLAPQAVTHNVNGKPVQFHQVSVGLAFKLRNIGGPLAEALAVIFADRDRDAGSVSRQFVEGNELIMEPISTEMASLRVKQRAEAIAKAIHAVTSEESLNIIGEIIIDSIRRNNGYFDSAPPTPKQFMEALPLPALTDMLIGVAKANEGLFSPLAARLRGAMPGVMDRVAESIGSRIAAKQSDPSRSDNNEAPTRPETVETDG